MNDVDEAWFALARDFTYTGPHDRYAAHAIVAEHRPAIEAALALLRPAPVRSVPARETTLDEAWAAAEEALPEGASVGVTKTVNVASGPYVATTDYGPVEHGYAYGPTPAAALHALAAALGRSESGGGRG